MKERLLYLIVALLAATSAVLTLAAALVHTQMDSAGALPPVEVRQGHGDLIARDEITTTIGIDDDLLLGSDGDLVILTGNAECVEGAETIALRFRVTQGSNQAPAIGAASWSCADGGNWEVTARTPPPFAFAEGSAEVCPIAIMQMGADGNVVGNQGNLGCQEVVLVRSARVP